MPPNGVKSEFLLPPFPNSGGMDTCGIDDDSPEFPALPPKNGLSASPDGGGCGESLVKPVAGDGSGDGCKTGLLLVSGVAIGAPPVPPPLFDKVRAEAWEE